MSAANHTGPTLSLQDLDADEARKQVGAIVLISVLLVTGTLGNGHVMLVYGCRMKSTTRKIFLLFLSSLDLLSCCVGMPLVLLELTHRYSLSEAAVCKLSRFILLFTCASSANVLLVITVERYRKICAPLRLQMTNSIAKMACAAAIFVALATSSPALVLYGQKEVETRLANATSTLCCVEERYTDTNYITYFSLFLAIIAMAVSITMLVLYCRVYKAVKEHTAFRFINTTTGAQRLSTYSSDYKTRPSVVSNSNSTGNFNCSQPTGSVISGQLVETDIEGDTLAKEMQLNTAVNVTGQNQVEGKDPVTTGVLSVNLHDYTDISRTDNTDRNQAGHIGHQLTNSFGQGEIAQSRQCPGCTLSNTGEDQQQTPAISRVIDLFKQSLSNGIRRMLSISPKDETLHHECARDKQVGTSSLNSQSDAMISDQLADRHEAEKNRVGYTTLDFSSQPTISSNTSVCKDERVQGVYINDKTGARMTVSTGQSRTLDRIAMYRRMTAVYFLIAAIFFVSSLPNLVGTILMFAELDVTSELSHTGVVLYNTFIWMTLSTKVSNPFIILYLDREYRTEVKRMYTRWGFCCGKGVY